MRYKKAWRRGDRSKVAATVGIDRQRLSNIMAGRKRCSPAVAEALAEACRALGYNAPAAQWVWPKERHGNPLFPAR